MNHQDNSFGARGEVENILKGGRSKIVPFTMYDNMIPQSTAERNMRNHGLGLVKRVAAFKTYRPGVKVKEYTYWEGDKKLTKTYYETPHGILSTLIEHAGITFWSHEKMFKTPDDYKALLFLIDNEVYKPDYDSIHRAITLAGDDIIFRCNFGLEPLQAFISGSFMDMQTFCMEWMDNRDEILKLYDALVEKRREIYPIVAQAPVLHANYGGNVTPEIIGLDAFRQYYIQHYNEAAEVMHKHGKLIGCHLDANCKLIAKDVAGTDLDYIEAFTPAPDTDMTLAEARNVWPNKILWLNYPSSVHLKTDEEIRQQTVELLSEIDDMQGIIMGITENIPEMRWQNSCKAIMDGLSIHATDKPQCYN